MKRFRVGKWKNQSGTPEYYTWRNLRRRCLCPSDPSYHLYGGSGISICSEWESYDEFYTDMGQRPDGATLDRIDPSKGYSKDNCRWTSWHIQALNKRLTPRVKSGEFLHSEAVRLGIKPNTANARLRRGLTEDRVLYQGDLRAARDLVHGTRSGYEYFRCRCQVCKGFNANRHRAFLAKRKAASTT